MKKMAALLAGIALLMTATSALALPLSYPGAPLTGDLQAALNNITVGGKSSVDVTKNMISDGNDAKWQITASGGSVTTMVIELAGFKDTNKLSVYDAAKPDNQILLFDGSNAPGSRVTLSINDLTGKVNVVGFDQNGQLILRQGKFASGTYGYFLDSSSQAGGGKFYSDSKLNESQNGIFFDHMLAFQGNNKDKLTYADVVNKTWSSDEYMLAFEDLYGTNSDFNFTDMLVMVESVEPVPEPGTILLIGGGLLGLAFYGRRRMKS